MKNADFPVRRPGTTWGASQEFVSGLRLSDWELKYPSGQWDAVHLDVLGNKP